jgi:hypothetical protein
VWVRRVTGARSAPIRAAMIAVVFRPEARPVIERGDAPAEFTLTGFVDMGRA